ncbi:MAG: 4Fe-4S dicluster domain-containing protein [Candidatus Rokubacteria bacterium]|nr:4Fe-4S dicluster domain-containing protein [Candidatus Rokubacteria bacterium]
MPADLLDLDALRTCVHCGICLPSCPTYRVLGEEMDSPRGRLYLMRAAAEGRVGFTATFARHFDLCLGCRACESACPSGVPFGSLLEATRAQLVRRGASSRRGLLGRLIPALFPHPHRLGAAFAALRLYQGSGLQQVARASGLLALAPRLAAMEALLPTLPPAERLPERVLATGRRRGRVGLLTGCVQRHLYPGVNRDTARLLSLAGWEVVIPRDQGCCGALDLHAGRPEILRARARALAAVFPADLDAIVVNAAGCGAAMKEYEDAAFAGRVRDVSEVLVDAELPLGPLGLRATYHDACHLAHGQRIRSEPRRLLGRIPGLELIPLADSALCCGSAGVYNLLEPGVADRLLDMKIDRICATGATTVVTGNPGCMLQIAKGCRARGLALDVVHPVELLARSVGRLNEHA